MYCTVCTCKQDDDVTCYSAWHWCWPWSCGSNVLHEDIDASSILSNKFQFSRCVDHRKNVQLEVLCCLSAGSAIAIQAARWRHKTPTIIQTCTITSEVVQAMPAFSKQSYTHYISYQYLFCLISTSMWNHQNHHRSCILPSGSNTLEWAPMC